MSHLENAIRIAVAAHQGQLDRAGQPYILHPLRVMARCQSADEKIVAVLHDVVEDTHWSFDDLRKEGFSEVIIQALDCVTKREGEPYEDFVRRSNRYSTLAAQDWLRRDRRVSLAGLVMKPLGRFLSMYIVRRGFLDGWRGFVLAVLYAEYVFLRMAKAWEARRAPGPHGGL